jgi:DNA helicase-2/ATP-dependent DNA helicase PcrA
LGHDDILKMVPTLIRERPLLCRVIAQKYPYFFFDESQDTDDGVVDAMKEVSREASKQGRSFCLGFFGDPMQKIYTAGKGSIDLLDGWASISKPENFRCPARVLTTINCIRRDGDGLQQIAGTRIRDGIEIPQEQGTSCIIILPLSEDRETSASRVRTYLAAKNADPLWSNDDPAADLRVLVIEHAMAARRLGFDGLYEIFNRGSESAKASFREGKHWALTPFQSLLLPLAEAIRNARPYEVMSLLRRYSPALDPKNFRQTANVVELLSHLKVAVQQLENLLAINGAATIGEVLHFAHDNRLIRLDGRITRALELPDDSEEAAQNGAAGDVVEAADTAEQDDPIEEVLLNCLGCPASQLWGYRAYVEDRSVYSTQQGIKGAEFQRVLVILDDDESNHFLFSYDKLFGMTPPSDRDRQNQAEGKETIVERTRRLFYVCCSRALKGLVVVCYTSAPDVLKAKVIESGLFPPDCIYGVADIQP